MTQEDSKKEVSPNPYQPTTVLRFRMLRMVLSVAIFTHILKTIVLLPIKSVNYLKTFLIHGEFKGVQLFGQNVSTGGKRIIITEGELDALAVAQAQHDKYGRFYPVVALPSASATSMILEQREWLRNFDEVVLMFDQDDAGKKATDQAAKIIGYDGVYELPSEVKDTLIRFNYIDPLEVEQW